MNKKELIEAITKHARYDRPSLVKANTEAVLDTLSTVIYSHLIQGNNVTLPGIGTLSVSERAARTGRNPQTGAGIEIAAKRVPKFSAAKAFKDAVA